MGDSLSFFLNPANVRNENTEKQGKKSVQNLQTILTIRGLED